MPHNQGFLATTITKKCRIFLEGLSSGSGSCNVRSRGSGSSISSSSTLPTDKLHVTPSRQVPPTSECVGDDARRSQGNHGYHTRAAMEETSRQSAEAADDDDSTSEMEVGYRGNCVSLINLFCFCP